MAKQGRSIIEQAADIGDISNLEDVDFAAARSQALINIYKEKAKRIKLLLNKTVRTDFQRWRLEQTLAQIKAEIAFLDKAAREWAPQAAEKAYERGSVFASTTAGKFLPDLVQTDLGGVLHRSAVAALGDQIAVDLITANASMANNATRLIRVTQQTLLEDSRVSQVVAEGLAGGETRRSISKVLKQEFQAQLEDGQLITAGGRNFTPEYYAELVARTRTREASTQGIINTQADYGLDLVQVSTHVSDVDVCTPYAGRVFSLSGNHPDFPMLDRKPPFHPNCKHVLMPVSETILRVRGQYDALVELSNTTPPASDKAKDIEEWAKTNKKFTINSTQDYHRYLANGDATKGKPTLPNKGPAPLAKPAGPRTTEVNAPPIRTPRKRGSK